MKHQKTLAVKTSHLLGKLKGIESRQRELAKKRAEIKQETVELRNVRRDETRTFIKAALIDFLETMASGGWARTAYIRGGYSDDFTKHVNRHLYMRGVNSKHERAINEYRKALENLNETFLEALENDPQARERLINLSGLKNLG